MGKPEEKRPLGRPGRKWGHIIYIKEGKALHVTGREGP
jgi:hypothetical protein